VIDQNAADDLCGNGEEVGAAMECGAALVDEFQIGLMDENSGLDSLSTIFAGKLATGDQAQFVVNKGN